MSSDLSSGDLDSVRAAVEMRYEAALAATRNPALVAANDTRYLWASEAKTQCAIAMGYLKSSTRDDTSLSKCDFAYRMMSRVATPPPPPAPPPPPPPPRPDVCDDVQPGLVFFEFDSDDPPGDAAQTVQFFTRNAQICGWSRFNVVGHTDRAGSDAYNDALSVRRANAVADLMASQGLNRNALSVSAQGEQNPRVPTADGVRSPENRRVEITVSQ